MKLQYVAGRDGAVGRGFVDPPVIGHARLQARHVIVHGERLVRADLVGLRQIGRGPDVDVVEEGSVAGLPLKQRSADSRGPVGRIGILRLRPVGRTTVEKGLHLGRRQGHIVNARVVDHAEEEVGLAGLADRQGGGPAGRNRGPVPPSPAGSPLR